MRVCSQIHQSARILTETWGAAAHLSIEHISKDFWAMIVARLLKLLKLLKLMKILKLLKTIETGAVHFYWTHIQGFLSDDCYSTEYFTSSTQIAAAEKKIAKKVKASFKKCVLWLWKQNSALVALNMNMNLPGFNMRFKSISQTSSPQKHNLLAVALSITKWHLAKEGMGSPAIKKTVKKGDIVPFRRPTPLNG